MKIFEVGGCVRDSFLGVHSKDIDFSVEATSFKAMREHFQNEGFRIFEIDRIEINYPSATSKAINKRIYSSHYRLDLMFRSTNGSIYPGDMTVFYVMNNLQEYMSH